MGFTERSLRAARTRATVHVAQPPPPHARWDVATAANRGYIGMLWSWLWHLRPHSAHVRSLVVLAEDPPRLARAEQLVSRRRQRRSGALGRGGR